MLILQANSWIQRYTYIYIYFSPSLVLLLLRLCGVFLLLLLRIAVAVSAVAFVVVVFFFFVVFILFDSLRVSFPYILISIPLRFLFTLRLILVERISVWSIHSIWARRHETNRRRKKKKTLTMLRIFKFLLNIYTKHNILMKMNIGSERSNLQ